MSEEAISKLIHEQLSFYLYREFGLGNSEVYGEGLQVAQELWRNLPADTRQQWRVQADLVIGLLKIDGVVLRHNDVRALRKAHTALITTPPRPAYDPDTDKTPDEEVPEPLTATSADGPV